MHVIHIVMIAENIANGEWKSRTLDEAIVEAAVRAEAMNRAERGSERSTTPSTDWRTVGTKLSGPTKTQNLLCSLNEEKQEHDIFNYSFNFSEDGDWIMEEPISAILGDESPHLEKARDARLAEAYARKTETRKEGPWTNYTAEELKQIG